MGIRMTRLPWFVLAAGLTGALTGLCLQWWTNAVDYPWIISGKPMWSLPANVPIIFELGVLFAAITALVSMLLLNGLPEPAHPLDLKERFSRSTSDRFFLFVQANDPKFDDLETRELLEETRPTDLAEVLEDRQTSNKLPTGLVYAVVILTVAALVPFALVAKARVTRSAKPRIHAVGDMDWQPKVKAQRVSMYFGDHRGMRPYEPGTVARGELDDDPHFFEGKLLGGFARVFPPQVKPTAETMERGKQRFGIYCAPCHGLYGEGDGMVTRRAQQKELTWVPPANLHGENIRLMPVGQLFDTITNGVRNMKPYGAQIPPADRWAVIMYIRALQKSQAASLADVPAADRQNLK
jgi:mono/diheme cytochrome c family protein